MGILDQYQKRREDKEKEDKKIMFCPVCGKKLLDNTFMHGSRKAGRAHCPNEGCAYRIIF